MGFGALTSVRRAFARNPHSKAPKRAHSQTAQTKRAPLKKPKVALPLLAGAALLGMLWFSFRDHDLEPARGLKPVQPAAAASPVSPQH